MWIFTNIMYNLMQHINMNYLFTDMRSEILDLVENCCQEIQIYDTFLISQKCWVDTNAIYVEFQHI